MSDEYRQTTDAAGGTTEARRAFLKRCGKYAIITPPAVSLLLDAASTPAEAAGMYRKSKRPRGKSSGNGNGLKLGHR